MKPIQITKARSFAATAVLSVITTVLLVLSFDGTWLHPDIAQALSVARNVEQGNGFSTGLVYYEEHYQLNTWPAPQTVFPIGFPAMIAILGYLGIPLRMAAFLIGATGFFLMPLLVCMAAQRMGRKPATGILLAALSLCFPMLWHNVWECQTELMFTALTLGSLVLLQSPSPNTRQLLTAGCLAALAISLRYAGIFWPMAVGCAVVVQILQRRWVAIRHGVTFVAIPFIAAISLFAKCSVGW